jgi:hypothetical protein
VGCDGSLNKGQHAHDQWVARFIEVCTTIGVSGSFLRSLFTGRAHGEPRPAGQTVRIVLRKGSSTGVANERSMEPLHSCLRVTRARVPLHRKVNALSTPRRQRLVVVSRKALPPDEGRRVDRRAREDACIGTGRSKRMELKTPSFSRESYPREWVDHNQRGDSNTIR